MKSNHLKKNTNLPKYEKNHKKLRIKTTKMDHACFFLSKKSTKITRNVRIHSKCPLVSATIPLSDHMPIQVLLWRCFAAVSKVHNQMTLREEDHPCLSGGVWFNQLKDLNCRAVGSPKKKNFSLWTAASAPACQLSLPFLTACLADSGLTQPAPTTA